MPARRRALRVPLRCEVTTLDGRIRRDFALNLSRGGICLQVERPTVRGERLHLRIPLYPHAPPVEAWAEVVWCTPESERAPGMRYYETGLRFVEVKPDDLRRIEAFVEHEANFEALPPRP